MSMAIPRIVVTGLSHAGINCMADMLTAGGAIFVTAADPHRLSYEAIDRRTLGLWIERDAMATARSALKAQNLTHPNRLTLNARFRHAVAEFLPARDAAAHLFAPLMTFRYEDAMRDPSAQAMRMARMFWPGNNLTDLGAPACPGFDPRAAALAVRRIAMPARARILHVVHG